MHVRVLSDPVLGELREATVEDGAWEELHACPICDRGDRLLDVARIEAVTPGATLAVCLDCDHYFKRRRPTTAWLESFYADEWDAQGRERARPKKPRSASLRFCEEFLAPGSRVLDMGAGFGRDIVPFKQAGHRVLALEASHHRARHIRQVLGYECLTAPFESAELPGDLDLIYSNHVLEHVTDPGAVLARAATVLRPGSLWAVTVPNCLSCEHPVQFVHFAPHQSGFTPASMCRLLERHGFDIVKVAVGSELRVLARRTDSRYPLSPRDAADDVERAATAWAMSGFGDKPGRRAITWWIAIGSKRRTRVCYDGRFLRTGRNIGLLDAVRGRYRQLPRSVRARSAPYLPPYVRNAHTMRVTVETTGTPELPVVIRYPAERPPIWIK